MSDNPPQSPVPPKPPWEAELEAQVLAEERARSEAAASTREIETKASAQAEAIASRAIGAPALYASEQERLLAEVDQLIAARRNEAELLGQARGSVGRLAAVFATGSAGARRPEWIIAITALLCLLIWLAGMYFSHVARNMAEPDPVRLERRSR